MLGFKTSMNKFNSIEIIQSMFSQHNGIKLEINDRKFGKLTNMWKLNITLLNKKWAEEEITREIKRYFDINENKDISKFMGYN